MRKNKVTPLATPTPLNRQSRNIAHVITSTISHHRLHLLKTAPGVTSPHTAKFTTYFFKFLCTQNVSQDLELRPLNRFCHAIYQRTRIHARAIPVCSIENGIGDICCFRGVTLNHYNCTNLNFYGSFNNNKS